MPPGACPQGPVFPPGPPARRPAGAPPQPPWHPSGAREAPPGGAEPTGERARARGVTLQPPVTPARRKLIAVVGSLALHLSPVLRGSCGFDVKLDMPELEFEITELETVELDQQLDGAIKPPEPPPAEPEVIPPPMGPDKPPEGEGPKPGEDKPEPPPKPKFGEKTSKVAELAPASSNCFMLLAPKKVAGLPFADAVVEVMSPLPDFDFIITGGGFHALRDFNYIVIASPNFRDLTQTFLAVEYKLTQAEMIAGLNRAAELEGQQITWEVREGHMMGNPKPLKETDKDFDPRWFVFVGDDVAVYAREEFLPAILTGPDESKGNTAGNFVANLTRLRSFAAREPRAGLQATCKDIRASIRLKSEPPFPIPNNLELMAEGSAKPELVIKLEFLDEVDATKGERQWTEDLPKFIDDKIPFYARFMVRSFYEATEVSRTEKTLQLRADFSTDQAKFILEQIAAASAKMLRRTPEEIEAARKRREEMWAARKNGKLTPSEALQGAEGKAAPPEVPSPGAPKPAPTGAPKPAPAPAPKPAPAPAPPQPSQ